MRSLTIALAVCCLATLSVVAVADAASTLGPRFLGGPGVKKKPRQVGVGAKGAFERLRWHGWGNKRAYARGVYDIAGFAGDPGTGFRSAVRLKAYGRKRCRSGNVVYTKVSYRTKKSNGGRHRFRARFATC